MVQYLQWILTWYQLRNAPRIEPMNRLSSDQQARRCVTMRLLIVSFTLFVWMGAPSRVYADLEVKQLDTGIYYGAFPKTDADYAELRSLGVRHIIDMRSFRRLSGKIEQRRAAARGMFYERLAVGFFPTRTNTTAMVLDRIVNQPCGPIYFHCTLGSDRTGLIVALYRVHQLNWSPCFAFQEWKRDQFNTKLKDLDRYFWQSVAGQRPAQISGSKTHQQFHSLPPIAETWDDSRYRDHLASDANVGPSS